jgi:hypothetical protein
MRNAFEKLLSQDIQRKIWDLGADDGGILCMSSKMVDLREKALVLKVVTVGHESLSRAVSFPFRQFDTVSYRY